MDSRLREAIKKNLQNRAENSKKRFAKQETIEKRLKEEERLYRVLKNHPELLEKKLKRDARLKALRKAKDAEIHARTKPKAKEEKKVEEKKLKPWSHIVEEQLPNGKWMKYDEVQNAVDELEPYGIVDKKSFREFAKKFHPDRRMDHGHLDDDGGAYQNEMFGEVMKQMEIVQKAKVPGFF